MLIESYTFNMQGNLIDRMAFSACLELLGEFKVLAIIGPRQCGKSTLAKDLLREISPSLYLDLERPSDARKLEDAELFFLHHTGLICIDEIQHQPDLFPILRSVVDANTQMGQFIILGSASRDLLEKSSESLAGRIVYVELAPFSLREIYPSVCSDQALQVAWMRGGYPLSFLAKSDKQSIKWRQEYIKSFLERDLAQLGFRVATETMRRLWIMLAHYHGQILNFSQLGQSLGYSHTSIRHYVEILCQTFVIRLLMPEESNVGKRLIKTPKIYIRDTGLFHALLEIDSFEHLMAQPYFGASWEGFVIEQMIQAYPDWRPSYYRTVSGVEVDLILQKGSQKIAIECKASLSPHVSAGFWTALEDLGISKAWVVYPGKDRYPLKKGVEVISLHGLLSLSLQI